MLVCAHFTQFVSFTQLLQLTEIWSGVELQTVRARLVLAHPELLTILQNPEEQGAAVMSLVQVSMVLVSHIVGQGTGLRATSLLVVSVTGYSVTRGKTAGYCAGLTGQSHAETFC